MVEQVQRIGGRFVVLPPKSAAGRRSVALPKPGRDGMGEHLAAFGGARPRRPGLPGAGGRVSSGRRTSEPAWLPAVQAPGCAPAAGPRSTPHLRLAGYLAAGANVKVVQRMLGHASGGAHASTGTATSCPARRRSVADRLGEMARRATLSRERSRPSIRGMTDGVLESIELYSGSGAHRTARRLGGLRLAPDGPGRPPKRRRRSQPVQLAWRTVGGGFSRGDQSARTPMSFSPVPGCGPAGATPVPSPRGCWKRGSSCSQLRGTPLRHRPQGLC